MTVKLEDVGYNLSRSSVYLRLLPQRKKILKSKLHKKVANVNLCRPMLMLLLAKNPDRCFDLTTMHHVEDLEILMEKKNFVFISNDDTTLSPLGIPAEKKQSSILLKMGYPVTLPDHTFFVPLKHKLILSIYASRQINDDGLTYSRNEIQQNRFICLVQ